MTKISATTTESVENTSLTTVLLDTPVFQNFSIWLVGDTPLLTHGWAEKSRTAMLDKQLKETKPGKLMRDPEADYESSMYEMSEGVYGFPVTGIKDCILSSAHKDKGVPRTVARASLWLNAQMVRVRPARAGAICDVPLVRIYGSPPQMREDMVHIGVGLRKTADLRYRGQFTIWAIRVTGRYNSVNLTPEALAYFIQESGTSCGIGEWRNDRGGIFGSFHLASVEEEQAWNAYASGAGALPLPDAYREAAE